MTRSLGYPIPTTEQGNRPEALSGGSHGYVGVSTSLEIRSAGRELTSAPTMAVAGNVFLSGLAGSWDNLGPEVL